jgi:hypothetical protein
LILRQRLQHRPLSGAGKISILPERIERGDEGVEVASCLSQRVDVLDDAWIVIGHGSFLT